MERMLGLGEKNISLIYKYFRNRISFT
jgi:hypothetical protein